MNEWERIMISIYILYGGKDLFNVFCSFCNRLSVFFVSIFIYIFFVILKNLCDDVFDWIKIFNR